MVPEFWGKSWNPMIVEELGAPDILLQYLLQAPRGGRADVKTFMTEFRGALPDPNVTGAAYVSMILSAEKIGTWSIWSRQMLRSHLNNASGCLSLIQKKYLASCKSCSS